MADSKYVNAYTKALAHRHVVSISALDGDVKKTDEAIFANLHSPNPWDNGVVLLTKPTKDSFMEIVEQSLSLFGSDPFTIWSEWFAEELEHPDLELESHPPVMLKTDHESIRPLEDFEIREATDQTAIEQLDETARIGFESEFGVNICQVETVDNPFKMFVGYWKNDPVTCSIATVAHGVVLVEAVATVPHARKHGFGAAMTLAAANIEPALPAVLTSSDSGLGVYESLGFEEIGTYSIWQRNSPTGPS